jgi:hypothetical protein
MYNKKTVTNDLSRFGMREYAMAGELLTAYGENGADFLGDGVQVWMNADSGNVSLCDSDYNVGMMNGDKLEQFFSCPECGHEGFLEDMDHNPDNEECQEYLKQINS